MKNFKKNYMHVIIGFLLGLLVWLILPAENGLTVIGVRTLAVFVTIVYYWITVDIIWPSLLVIAAFSMVGTASYSTILAGGWGNYIFCFLVVGSLINYSIEEVGLIQRLLNWFISRKIVKGRPWMFLFIYAIAMWVVGMFFDLMVVTLLGFALCKSLSEEMDCKPGDKLSTSIHLIGMWCGTIGFAGTPIGHNIPLLAISLMESTLGKVVTLGQYMMFGVPTTFVLTVLCFLIVKFVIRPDVSNYVNYNVEARRAQLTKWTKREKWVAGCFVGVIFMYFIPEFFKGTALGTYWATLSVVVSAIICVVFMCIVHVDDKPLLDIKVAMNKVPWGTCVLVAGMFSLSTCLSAPSTGIVEWLTGIFMPITQSLTSWIPFVGFVVIASLVMTNFMSCAVTCNIIYVVAAPLAAAISSFVNPYAATIILGVTCSMGFMTPPASAPSAVYLGTDYCPPRDGFKYGAVLLVVGIIVGIFILYPLAALALPL